MFRALHVEGFSGRRNQLQMRMICIIIKVRSKDRIFSEIGRN